MALTQSQLELKIKQCESAGFDFWQVLSSAYTNIASISTQSAMLLAALCNKFTGSSASNAAESTMYILEGEGTWQDVSVLAGYLHPIESETKSEVLSIIETYVYNGPEQFASSVPSGFGYGYGYGIGFSNNYFDLIDMG